jgi:GTPase SAR1 family protein
MNSDANVSDVAAASAESTPRRVVQLAAAMLAESGNTMINEQIKGALHRLELGLFRLVVMGEIKKGKSSFINALLGERDLLPVASDVATSTVYKVIYGKQRQYKVFYQPDVDTGARQPPKVISPDEVASYGTEDGNSGNRSRVDFIAVETPNPLLKQGLVIVDTPGIGGLYRAHKGITWRYAPNADAVVFVTDSVESVLSEQEVDFIRELRSRITKRLIFVQTKIDACDTEQARQWSDRNRQILVEKANLPEQKLIYFPLSAHLKHAADEDRELEDLRLSGYESVLRLLHENLLPAKEYELACSAAQLLQPLIGHQRVMREDELRILRTESAEELSQLDQQLRESKQAAGQWASETFEPELRALSRDLRHILSDARRSASEHLDVGGPTHQSIMGVITESNLADRLDREREIGGALESACGQLLQRLAGEVSGAVDARLAELTHRLGLNGDHLHSGTLAESETLFRVSIMEGGKTSRLDSFRSHFYSTNLGLTLGGLGGALLFAAGTIATGGITAIAAGGALTALIVSMRDSSKKTSEQRQRESEAALRDALRRCERSVLDKLAEIERGYTEQIQDLVLQWKRDSARQFDSLIASINEKKRLTREDVSDRVRLSQSKLSEMNDLESRLGQIIGKEPG